MRYEVEMKFPAADLEVVAARLAELGVTISGVEREADVYFAHPARDFAATDEALRIRRKAEANFLAYKGPKIDAETKTRREIDLALPPGEASAREWTALLEALGFSPVGEVRKSRRKARLAWRGRTVEISLDQVERLGGFVELEVIAEPEEVEEAKACLASLAQAMALEGGERRSYLELLYSSRSA